MAIFFLLPAILIERKRNPVWVKVRNEAEIKKLEAEIVANQQRKEEAIRLQQLQEENNRLCQEITVITKQPENNQSTIKKIPPANTKKNNVPLLHQIFGAICVFFGAIFTLGTVSIYFTLGAVFVYENDFLVILVAGIVIGIVGVLFLTGAMRKAEQTRRIKHVYLTKEQINRLEQKIELPVLDVPVFLNYGKVAVYHSQATRQETKKRVIGRTGSYGDISMQYPGEFIITNERVIFLSNQKGFELNHQNITAITAYKDGFAFQRKNTSYVLLIPRTDLAKIAFDGVRTGEIPIAGINTSNNSHYDDYDEFNLDDISSIDGMEGHDFEYFCADVLRKNGFFEVSVTKGSGDQGVDVLATKGGIKHAIQCKNYASPLSNTPIQEVNAGKSFYNCHVGVVMPNSTFTPGAKALAEVTGVLLWDRVVLQEMMKVTE